MVHLHLRRRRGFGLCQVCQGFRPKSKMASHTKTHRLSMDKRFSASLTVRGNEESKIKQVFETTRPFIFDSQDFVLTENMEPAREVEKDIKTTGNIQLKIFGKSSSYGRDIYSDLISPKIGDSLLVETWRQNGKLENNNAVTNAPLLRFNNGLEFNSGVDHSKWAVAETLPWTCFGDINRHESQFKRGGLSLCLHDAKVAKEFRSLFVQHDSSTDAWESPSASTCSLPKRKAGSCP